VNLALVGVGARYQNMGFLSVSTACWSFLSVLRVHQTATRLPPEQNRNGAHLSSRKDWGPDGQNLKRNAGVHRSMLPITAGFHGPAVSILIQRICVRCNAKQKGDGLRRNIYFDFPLYLHSSEIYAMCIIPVMEKASRLSGAGRSCVTGLPARTAQSSCRFFCARGAFDISRSLLLSAGLSFLGPLRPAQRESG